MKPVSMTSWMFLAAIFLITVEISISQKNKKLECRAPGHMDMESHPDQWMGPEPCATASITKVQICEDGEWKAICSEQSTAANTKVLCRVSGYSAIGGNVTRLSQSIGSEISSFRLNCNGSETNPEDCLVKSHGSATSHCQRTVIQCFLTDPDPQLCNISLSTTLPEYKTTVLDHTNTVEASTTPLLSSVASIPPLASTSSADLSLVKHTTAVKRSDKDTNKITIVPIIGIVIAVLTIVTALIICFVTIMIICLRIRRRKHTLASQTERSKQKQKESQLFDTTSEYVVIAECKQEIQQEGMEHGYLYTKNDAYGSKPGHFNQRPGGVTLCVDDTPSGDQQQNVEPIYETIPDPKLISHTIEWCINC